MLHKGAQKPVAKVSLSRLGHVMVVTPGDEIRVRDVVGLRRVLEPLSQTPTAVVAIDLSGVKFIDSSGIGLLTNAAKRLLAGNGRLYLFGCNRELRELLEMVGIRELAPVLKDIDELRAVTSGSTP